MEKRLTINLETDEPMKEGGLRSPRDRLSSTTASVQNHVREAFGEMMPWIRTDNKGNYWYENIGPDNRETVFDSRLMKPGEPFPMHELAKMLEGWKLLLSTAAEMPESSMRHYLLNFQLPDPVELQDRYRLYRDASGIIRMHVLWGFYPKGKRYLSLQMEHVLEAMKVDMPDAPPPMPPSAYLPESARKPWALWSVKKSSQSSN